MTTRRPNLPYEDIRNELDENTDKLLALFRTMAILAGIPAERITKVYHFKPGPHIPEGKVGLQVEAEPPLSDAETKRLFEILEVWNREQGGRPLMIEKTN